MSEDDGDSDADGDEVDDLASVGSYGDNALERGEYRALKTMSGGVELQRSSRSQEIPTNSRASSYGSRASNKHAKRRKGQLSQTERAARARARRPSRRYLRRCTMPTPWRLANVTHVGACLARGWELCVWITNYGLCRALSNASSVVVNMAGPRESRPRTIARILYAKWLLQTNTRNNEVPAGDAHMRDIWQRRHGVGMVHRR